MTEAEDLSLPAPYERFERVAQVRLWWKIRQAMGRIPFAEDLAAAFYCAADPSTPARVRMALMGALAYFILPFDAIPDVLIGFGFTDDASVLAATLAIVGSNITSGHRAAARRVLLKPDPQ
jgi:uncharacterized membrane protein YkvA (DUF1232 family)